MLRNIKIKLKEHINDDNDKDYQNKHKKQVATRIMGRYWDDKSYNEKMSFLNMVPLR
jgi:hypothetical protein